MKWVRAHAAVINTVLLLAILAFTVPTMLSAGPRLKALATQVQELRELAGLQGGYQRELVQYASSVLGTIETLSGKGVQVATKGVGGRSEPLEDWLVGARREALGLVFMTKSKKALLTELCQSLALNRPFHLRFEDGREVTLEAWLRETHAETREL